MTFYYSVRGYSSLGFTFPNASLQLKANWLYIADCLWPYAALPFSPFACSASPFQTSAIRSNDLCAWWNSSSRISLSSHAWSHAARARNHLTLFAVHIIRSRSCVMMDVYSLSICHSASSAGESPLGLPTIQYHGSSVFASPCAAGAFSFLHHSSSLSSGRNDLSSAERLSARRAFRTHQYLSAALTLSFERLKRNCSAQVFGCCPQMLSSLNLML